MITSIFDDIHLEEDGIESMVQRWNSLSVEVLRMEIVGNILSDTMPVGQKEPSKKNMITYLEKKLRSWNERKFTTVSKIETPLTIEALLRTIGASRHNSLIKNNHYYPSETYVSIIDADDLIIALKNELEDV